MKNTSSTLCIIISLIICQDLNAQVQKYFDSQKAERLSVGDTLIILKSAVALDSSEFESIRLNIENYKALRVSYQKNINANRKLVKHLISTQSKLHSLIKNTELESNEIDKLKSIVSDMNTLSTNMEEVNDSFESNNEALNKNIEAMKENNKRLNQEIHRIKAKNIKSHIITGLLGATIGLLIASAI